MDRDIRSSVFGRVLSVVSFSIQAETRRFELAVPQRVVRTKGLGTRGSAEGGRRMTCGRNILAT